MKISIPALQLCAKQYGNGPLVGISTSAEATGPSLESDTRRIFDELVESGMLEFGEDSVGFSSLGRVIMSMMTNPDIFISITNRASDVHANLYVSDVYYLCVLDDDFGSPNNLDKALFVDLLPDLERVVGLFVHAIHIHEDEHTDVRRQGELSAEGMLWDYNRALVNEWHMNGTYKEETIICGSLETSGDRIREEEPREYEDSDAINKVTEWLFARLAENMTAREGM